MQRFYLAYPDSDFGLPVTKDLLGLRILLVSKVGGDAQEATVECDNGNTATLHYCPACGGWIAGMYRDFRVDDMGPLSGRRGRVYCCRRCGDEVYFMGCVS